MRAFLAFNLPSEQKLEAIEAINSFKALIPFGVKWVEDENLHITLSFLGDINDAVLDDINRIIEERLAEFDCNEFKISGVEVVPSNRPKIVWIKLDADSGISKWVKRLNKELATFCPDLDIKAYKPHITLGRIKDVIPVPVMKRLLSYPVSGLSFKSPDITLYKSILSKKGPRYISLFDYEL